MLTIRSSRARFAASAIGRYDSATCRGRCAARLNSGVRAVILRFIASLTALGLLASCDGPYYAHRQTPVTTNIKNSQFQLEAFDGTLYGQDRGEWIGGLYFRDQADRTYEVIDQNVHGLIRNSSGVFVFTGLAHLSLNEGYIYRLAVDSDRHIVPQRLGRLPGAPSRVTQHKDGITSFLVYAGYVGDKQHFRCLALDGLRVTDSNRCDRPSR